VKLLRLGKVFFFFRVLTVDIIGRQRRSDWIQKLAIIFSKLGWRQEGGDGGGGLGCDQVRRR